MNVSRRIVLFFFFQAEDGIRDKLVTGVQTCALPIWSISARAPSIALRVIITIEARDSAEGNSRHGPAGNSRIGRSEEHTSELQSLAYLVCRLLLEKKNGELSETVLFQLSIAESQFAG